MSRLADILSGLDRGRSRPRGLGGIPNLAPPPAPRRRWRMSAPLVILGGMAAIGVAVLLRPHPGTAPVQAPAASPQPLVRAVPAESLARREADEGLRPLLSRGAEAVERGAFGEAASLLRQATKLAPGDPEAWNGLGVALVSLGEVAAGVEAFRRAVRLQPTHAEAERNLGVALDRQGKPREAAAHYRTFLSLSTEGHPARTDVRRRLIEISSRKGDE